MGFLETVFGCEEINHSPPPANKVLLKWHFSSFLCYIEYCHEKTTNHIVNWTLNRT
jgi:hypothetical protein